MIGFVVFVNIGKVSSTKCKVVNKDAQSSVFAINDQPDAGIVVKALLKNAGKSGNVDIVASVSTSEGSFKRSQKIYLKEGQQKEVSFQFHEPTVNATNVQYNVSCK